MAHCGRKKSHAVRANQELLSTIRISRLRFTHNLWPTGSARTANFTKSGANQMLSQSLQDSLNEQIENEFYSGHVYLAMSSWFEDKGQPVSPGGCGCSTRKNWRTVTARIAGQDCNSTFISGSVRHVRGQTPHPTSRLSAVRCWCFDDWDDRCR